MDGSWESWGDWSDCSSTCGGGQQFRVRLCANPLPEFGGSLCISHEIFSLSITNAGTLSETDTVSCNVDNCPTTTVTGKTPSKGSTPIVYITPPAKTDGVWGTWDNWNSCSSTCGGGHQSRNRFCNSPLPEAGGSLCPSNELFLLSITKDGTLKETNNQACNNNDCPTTTGTEITPPNESTTTANTVTALEGNPIMIES